MVKEKHMTSKGMDCSLFFRFSRQVRRAGVGAQEGIQLPPSTTYRGKGGSERGMEEGKMCRLVRFCGAVISKTKCF